MAKDLPKGTEVESSFLGIRTTYLSPLCTVVSLNALKTGCDVTDGGLVSADCIPILSNAQCSFKACSNE